MHGYLAIVLTCLFTLVGQEAAERPGESHAWDSLVTQLGVKERSYLLSWNANEPGLVLLDQHLEDYPDSPHREHALYLRAVGLWGMYRYPEAADAYASYLAAFPDQQRALIAMTRHVQSLVRSDRPGAAIAAVKAYESRPAGEQRQLSLVDALALLGRVEEARTELQSMIDAAEGDPRMGRMVDMLEARQDQLAWIGKPLASFAVKAWKTGESLTPGSFQGRVLLIEFWATWCKPCMAQVPHLVSLYGRLHDQGFDVLGVDLDDNSARLQATLERHGMTWPQFNDGRKWDNEMAVAFDVHRIPFAILVDRTGIVRYIGPPQASLDRLVSLLLERKSVGTDVEDLDPKGSIR